MDTNLHTGILQICRPCMKEIIDTSFFYLDCAPSVNTQLTIGQTLYSCIPELDLSIVSNSVMCRKCVDNLLSVFKFKRNCLESEMQINKYVQQVEHTSDLNLVEVVRFHQPNIKNLDIEIKTEDLIITEDLVCDTSAFNEANECTGSFQQPDIKNLDVEVKREDFKNDGLDCETSEFNEAEEFQEVDMQDVFFNTFDDYNINYNLSAAEENSDIQNSNIQNCLPEVIELQDSYSKNLNKTNAHYQCYRCGHKVASKLKLISHLKCPTQKNFCRKEVISKRFSRYKKLISYYRCSLCKYLTKYKCLFDFHIGIHLPKKNNKHIFKLANVRTTNFRTTIKINKTNIKGNKRKLVTNCNKYYKHSFKNRSKSKKSKQHLSYRNSLKSNVKAHTVERLFKCSICEYHCNLKGNLKQHMLIHTGEKPFSCSVCEYQCRSKVDLKRHVQIHTGEKPFLCSVCEYQCSHKSNLKQHMLIHTGEKPFSCSVCEYQCSHKSNLKRHMLIHTGEKPFSCSVCEYQCSHKISLKQHVQIHTGEKPFSCYVCKYKCRSKGDLKRHVQIHTGEKPFACPICDCQFNRKSYLKQHMLIHTGEKPFSCSVCEYQCSQKSSLKAHMLIHTGEKPFSCSVCEYQCRRNCDLKRHMQIHT